MTNSLPTATGSGTGAPTGSVFEPFCDASPTQCTHTVPLPLLPELPPRPPPNVCLNFFFDAPEDRSDWSLQLAPLPPTKRLPSLALPSPAPSSLFESSIPTAFYCVNFVIVSIELPFFLPVPTRRLEPSHCWKYRCQGTRSKGLIRFHLDLWLGILPTFDRGPEGGLIYVLQHGLFVPSVGSGDCFLILSPVNGTGQCLGTQITHRQFKANFTRNCLHLFQSHFDRDIVCRVVFKMPK